MAEPLRKKPRKKRRDREYVFTPAQELMRADIERVNNEPKSIGQVFDETMDRVGINPEAKSDSTISQYGAFQRDVPGLALTIIDNHDLVLTMKQWAVVQSMVEEGIRVGWEQRR